MSVRIYTSRNGGVLHRDAVTAVDKITDFVDASVTIAKNNTGGTLGATTTYYVTAIPGNRWGCCKVNANIDSVATDGGAADNAITATIAQATGAEWYDIFLSTDAAPKLVGRVTEAQRAAGDFQIQTMGAVTAGGGNAAGTVLIGTVGTGIQTSATVFAQNNAYRPATVTAINCEGYDKARIKVKLALTDLRTAPALTLVPFFGNQVSTSDYHAGTAEALTLLTALGYPMCQEYELSVKGESKLVVLVGTITGQGAAASVWVELS